MLRLHTDIQSSPSLGNLQGYREVTLIPWVFFKESFIIVVCMMYVWAWHAMARVDRLSSSPLCEFQGLDSIKQMRIEYPT